MGLREDILMNMSPYLNTDAFDQLTSTLDMVLNDYVIEQKSYELVSTEDSDFVIVKNFLGNKILENKSPKTIEHYRGTINRMLNDINKPIKEITTDDIRQHLARWKINRNISPVTQNNMRSVYCSFFGWLELEKIISTNPMKRIKPNSLPKKQIKPFTDIEIEKMRNACTSTRDRALIEFLYSTGVRGSECSDFNIDDIDFMHKKAIVRSGKGNKERTVLISNISMFWLNKYLSERHDNEVALWVGKKGRLTLSGIEDIIRRLGDKGGVVGAHPHRFRHSFATDLINRGAPAPVVQKLLGHEDISTTMIYAEIKNTEVESVFRKFA